MRDVLLDLPAAECREPPGIREVVERHHGRDGARATGEEHLAVVVDRRFVVATLLGLDAAPLEGEAVGAEAHGAKEVQVLLVALPVTACRSGAVAVPDLPGELLPIPPVVPVVAALHLVSGRGRSPEKAARASWIRHAPPGSRSGVRDKEPGPRSACEFRESPWFPNPVP